MTDDDLAEEAGGATVDVVAADDVIAGVEHGDEGSDGGHAAAEDVTGGSAFERGEIGFEGVPSGVGDAGVFPAAVFLDALEFVGGGEVDGDVDGAGARVGFLSVVDGAGGEAVLGVSHVKNRVQGTGCGVQGSRGGPKNEKRGEPDRCQADSQNDPEQYFRGVTSIKSY